MELSIIFLFDLLFLPGSFAPINVCPPRCWEAKLDSFFFIQKLYRHILRGLAVVLQDDSDVHVDDDEEADDQVGEEEGDGHDGVPAVSLVTRLRISCEKK